MEPNLTTVNILLVDDNESNLLALETILHGESRNLIRAGSGNEALQYLLYNRAAVILMDVCMPGIDGLETAELIRGRKDTRDIPIIFLTAYDTADRANMSRGYSLGAVDYLIKPLDPEALKAKVNVFVELSRKTEEVRSQAALLHEKNIELENANFQRLGKLIELGQQLTAERNPDRLLQLFCESSRDILSARNSYIRIAEWDGQQTNVVVGCELDLETLHLNRKSVYPEGLTRFSSSKPFRVSALQGHSNITSLKIDKPANSLLSLPILLRDRTIGWLYLVHKSNGDEFSEADERLAMTLAGQLSVSYENARLYADVQDHARKLQAEIVERKRAESEKERLLLSEQAARIDAENAQRLSAELLIREGHARAEAETANRLKDEFLATVSHELRTPVNSILGWVELLRGGSLDPETSVRALNTIARNTRSLAQIIDDLLDVSRIITGKLTIDARPVELSTVIDTVLDATRPAVDAKGIQIEVVRNPNTGVILGDPNRLQQIAWNLIANAIKFTPAGGSVKVTLDNVQSDAYVCVEDSGEGIVPEFLPYVFDRFRQADSTFSRLHGGLGLGLAIVRHLVEMHGGTVKAESPGKDEGSKFTVTFPLMSAASSYPSKRKHDQNSDGQSSIAGLRILVVDDDKDSRELLITILERGGAKTITATSVTEALQIIQSTNGSPPDILLSDIGMPGADGFTLISKIRAMDPEQGGTIPGIALTSYASPDDRARILAAGFQRHVPKPVEPGILIQAVAELARSTPDVSSLAGSQN